MDEHTKKSILAVPLPPTPNLELLTEYQERMSRNLLAMMGLPFPLNPHDPDIKRVNGARDEADDGE